jgi:hypothetical protein
MMSSIPKNSRVGAILSTDEDGTVLFLGYGEYVGDEYPEDAVGVVAQATRELKMGNPKIVLDNGKVVWGCECWWGAEEAVKEFLEKAPNVRHVDIDDARAECLGEQE